MAKRRALSIRQPWAELILRGEKLIEYRPIACRKLGERVYIYAALKAEKKEILAYRMIGLDVGDLPTGVLVGTMVVDRCTGRKGDYEWHIRDPQRLARYRRPQGMPQPVWFIPWNVPSGSAAAKTW